MRRDKGQEGDSSLRPCPNGRWGRGEPPLCPASQPISRLRERTGGAGYVPSLQEDGALDIETVALDDEAGRPSSPPPAPRPERHTGCWLTQLPERPASSLTVEDTGSPEEPV